MPLAPALQRGLGRLYWHRLVGADERSAERVWWEEEEEQEVEVEVISHDGRLRSALLTTNLESRRAALL